MPSCLYQCRVSHHRFTPKVHHFAYRIFLFAIDLDELGAWHRKLTLFSVNRPNLYSFRESDYLPTGQGAGLKDRVVAHLSGHGVDLSGGRVLLLTLPRVAGYVFNPVSFYFCYDRTGAPVAALAEVTNTFKEMKVFFLGPQTRGSGPGASFRRRLPKYFYVSPFSDVDVAFDFDLRPPGEKLAVKIDDFAGTTQTLASHLTGERRPLTDRRLAAWTILYPLITLRIIALIHWHALKLWLKGAPWFAKTARAAEQTDLYRPHHSLAGARPSDVA